MEEFGIMLDFNPREYSIRELYDSYNSKETVLSPKFQRFAEITIRLIFKPWWIN